MRRFLEKKEQQKPIFDITDSMSEEDFASAVETLVRFTLAIQAECVALQKERENHIVDHLPQTLEEVFDTYPALKKKDRVHVLLQMGSFHTRVFHLLKKDLPETKRDLPSKPYVFSYEEEISRRLLFEKPINGSLVSHALLETLVVYCLPAGFTDDMTTDDRADFIRDIAKQFSDGEIAALFVHQADNSLKAIINRIGAEIKRKKLILSEKHSLRKHV